jgi:DASH complex subunit DAD2
MSYSSRPLPSHLRQASTSGNSSNGQSPILLARINEKKAELENLKQLRDLSAGLAGQMQMLEEKLATLSDGTEGWVYNSTLRFMGLIKSYSCRCRLKQLA